MSKIPSLAIVVPCYNEQEVLPESSKALSESLESLIRLKKVSDKSRILFVDDGSRDNTWELLRALAENDSRVSAVKLSRNRGHQKALYAGLRETHEDIVVSIDADLQDGPENIEKMIDKHRDGADVVFGVRSERRSDTYFKRITAEIYYKFMLKIGVNLVFNHADFRLMSRRALDAFMEYSEVNLFLRGIAKEIGYKTAVVEYSRRERQAGESKYPFKKMLSLAWDGVTSFSSVPLKAITALGFFSALISTGILLWVLVTRILSEQAVPGWASILLPLLFIGSVQLLCIGVLGEYLAKIYSEVKRRPHYHIDEKLNC